MGYELVSEEAKDLTLPKDSVHQARLDEVKKRELNWIDARTGEERSSDVLEFWWTIQKSSLGDEYVGRHVKGTCDFNFRTGGRFYTWASALLDREFPPGMKLNTDDLIGLSAEISIGHRPDKKDPNKVWEFVDEVMPLETSSYADPPF